MLISQRESPQLIVQLAADVGRRHANGEKPRSLLYRTEPRWLEQRTVPPVRNRGTVSSDSDR
jgi:hypothetical protein